MIDLDELEEIAKAATQEPCAWSLGQILLGDTGDYCKLNLPTHALMKDFFFLSDAVYLKAFNPTTALEMIATIRRYREALEWYADESNMKSLTGLPYGRRARLALASIDRIEGESK